MARAVVNRNEIIDLMREHEAIRAQLTWMTDSLSILAKQLGQRKAQLVQIKDQLRSCRLTLHDLKDGLQRHIELDERIFDVLGGSSVGEITGQHEEILKEVNGALRLADDILTSELSSEELIEHALNIGQAVKRIRELIKVHTAKEDRLLMLKSKDL